jgi:uncharacterized membrane protein YjgN (DUF898 family)
MLSMEEQPATSPVPDRLTIAGDGGNLLAIHLMGLFLTLITLGIYRFWWRTSVRRYLWSAVRYKDEPLEYTGRGLELFVGFLIVLLLVVAPLTGAYFAGLWLIKNGHFVLGGALVVGLYLLLLALLGAAVYRVAMYRLSRTRWRGIRAALGGSSLSYTGRYVALLLLQVVTLGFATPYVAVRLYRYLLNNVWFGSGRLRFEADWKPLFKYYLLPGVILLGAFGLIVVGGVLLGRAAPPDAAPDMRLLAVAMTLYGAGFAVLLLALLAICWYYAALLRLVAAGCEFEGVRFSIDLTGGRLCLFAVGNVLLLAVTWFIAYPWVQLRILRFGASVLAIHGEPDFARISQNTALAPRFGEGLGEAFL